MTRHTQATPVDATEDDLGAAHFHDGQAPARPGDLLAAGAALVLAAAAVYGAWHKAASHAPAVIALATGYAALAGIFIVLALYHRRRDPGAARTLAAKIGANLADTYAMGSMEAVQLTALALPWLAAAGYGACRLLSG